MTSDAARVVLVLPTARADYFGTAKYATAWQVRNALRVAERLCAGAGVDVFLYGNPADGRHADEGVAVRTRVEPASLAEWTAEWAVLSNDGLGFLGDARPPGRVERTFVVGGPTWFTSPLGALREVSAVVREGPGPTLVIFQIDSRIDQRGMVLGIRDTGEEAAFWQVFGRERSVDQTFWRQDGLHRGRVLPNLAVHFDAEWSHRSVARRFARWRKRTRG
ncbi:hypothetical protein ACFPM3_30195 [Streptomyces coeruleoprunus]|uniref:Uncharacterized protein n=1 Tax=Streptomyces coeruleoprunus TaxID=285563 RepID=A0ABV9XPK4_9ACTN